MYVKTSSFIGSGPNINWSVSGDPRSLIVEIQKRRDLGKRIDVSSNDSDRNGNVSAFEEIQWTKWRRHVQHQAEVQNANVHRVDPAK